MSRRLCREAPSRGTRAGIRALAGVTTALQAQRSVSLHTLNQANANTVLDKEIQPQPTLIKLVNGFLIIGVFNYLLFGLQTDYADVSHIALAEVELLFFNRFFLLLILEILLKVKMLLMYYMLVIDRYRPANICVFCFMYQTILY